MRLVAALAVAFAATSPAAAQTFDLDAVANRASGAAPLTATLTATGSAVSYRWELGDGTVADGPSLTHVYRRPGLYTAVVTATYADGSVASDSIDVVAYRLFLARPGPALAGGRLRLHARVEPRLAGARVELVRGRSVVAQRPTSRRGEVAFVVRARRGPFRARLGDAVSESRAVSLVRPQLTRGSRGRSVLELERRLAALRYALPRTDRTFGLDTYQAVLAFQKIERLPWTGSVDARTWRRLLRAQTPRPRYRGTHLEVSKHRQVLYAVRNGRVQSIVHVSTGATGNTPLGRWRIYRKVPGWDWVLWYPMYFLRGFAVHGYPSVPAYPASHGCVRVPMWVAPRLFRTNRYGGRVYVYS